MKNYKYDAFISYRHGGIDQFVAENLHKQMETFKLPKNIMDKTNGKTKIQRVFRDQEELPLASNLGDPIQEALEDSEWLVVICSPRLRESKWCQTEIETFIKLHGREKVLAVLVEGEPSESFPEQLLYAEEEVTNSDGTTSIVKRAVEPLAADVRGSNNSEVLKAMKLEILRLLAPMFGVSFDDLRQRHRERRMRKIITVSLSAAAVSLAFGAVSTVMAVRINSQKKEIAEQNEVIVASNVEIQNQAEEIKAQAEEIKSQNEKLTGSQAEALAEKSKDLLSAGDRIGALKLAVESLTETVGVKLPITAEGKYALNKSLYPYMAGSRFVPVHMLKTDGIVNGFTYDNNAKYIICSDATKNLYLFDLENGELLDKLLVSTFGTSDNKDAYKFIDDDRFVYITDNGALACYSVSKKEKVIIDDSERYSQLKFVNGKYLWCVSSKGIKALDIADLSGDAKFEVKMELDLLDSVSIVAIEPSEERIAYTRANINNKDLYTCDVKSGESLIIDVPENENLSEVRVKDNLLYTLTTDVGDVFSMKYVTTVRCYNAKNGNVKWDLNEKGMVGLKMNISYYPESDKMLVASSSEALLINQDTGKLVSRMTMESTPIEIMGYATSANYNIIDREGNLLSALVDTGVLYQSNIFEGYVGKINTAKMGGGLICTSSNNSNAVIVYKMCQADGAEQVVEVPELDGIKEYSAYNLDDFASENGFENTDMIVSAIVYEDENLAFVTYYDGKTHIFNLNDKSEIATIAAGMDAKYFYGKDNDGNYYFGNPAVAYILNSDFEIIGEVEKLQRVLKDENRLIVSGVSYSDFYSLPIISFDEQLEKAQAVISENAN